MSPLPNLRPEANVDPKLLHVRERRVLATINAVLKGLTLAPLNRVTQLYTGAELTVLRTFRELDHYPERVGGHYWGCAPQSIGEVSAWPAVPGKKVFAYLKPFAGVAKLLSALKSYGQPTLVYGDGLDPRLTRQFASDTLVFSSAPVDMRATAAQCDGAVLHGTHNTAINLLLAGKPMLQLPLTLEQLLFAQTLERLNAGITLRHAEPTAVVDALKRLLEDGSRHAAGAQAFAARHADWDAPAQEERWVSRLDECLTGVRGAHSMGDRGRSFLAVGGHGEQKTSSCTPFLQKVTL